jgi:transcriptional regulator GlxA family with amidase domain
VRSQGFLAVTPDTTVDGPEVPDIAVVPGGDVTGAMKSEAALRWLSRVTAKGGVVFTVCNGASVAAKAGLLDGKDVTTHHGNADLLSLLAPSARVHVDRRVVDNDRLVTAAGISAGIDGALYLVARLGGMEVARAAATHMEYEPWPALETQIAAALEQPGTRSVRGRTFTATEDWAIFRVLRVLRASGAAPAEEELRRSLASARGHDLEMIEAAGLAESAQWLLESSRDPAAVLPLFDLNARVNPGSVVACDARAGALERLGRAEEARAERGRCSRLAPAAAGRR